MGKTAYFIAMSSIIVLRIVSLSLGESSRMVI
jgi:hypothetical protein